MDRLIWILAYVSKSSTPNRALEFANAAYADYVAKWPEEEAERLPVYRLRNGAEHFYTIDPNERDSAISNYGYILEGVAFYAFRDPQ
jgi:hypothetical protein